MAKRKLNRRQLWRIEKIQAEKEQRLLKNEAHIESQIEALGEKHTTEYSLRGLVIAKHGKQIEIAEMQTNYHSTETKIFLCHMRENITSMVVGDEVIWTKIEDNDDNYIGIIESLFERRSYVQ